MNKNAERPPSIFKYCIFKNRYNIKYVNCEAVKRKEEGYEKWKINIQVLCKKIIIFLNYS